MKNKLYILLIIFILILIILLSMIIFTNFFILLKLIFGLLIITSASLLILFILITNKNSKKKSLSKINNIENKYSIFIKSYSSFIINLNQLLNKIYINNNNILEKKKIDLTSTDNIEKNLETIEKHIVKLNENIVNINSSFDIKISESKETNYELFEKIFSSSYYFDIFEKLLGSLIQLLNSSMIPLSEGIYKIKLQINDFLIKIKKWENEFIDIKSNFNFDNIIKKYNFQNEEFSNLFQIFNNNNSQLEINLSKIVKLVEGIFQNTDAIEEISAKIRILSINASIESARSGESGKGFKIVADAIKKLSGSTQLYIKNIEPIIMEAKKIVNKTMIDFSNNTKKIDKKLLSQKDEFESFYDTIANYYNNFKTIFSLVSDVINNINENIDSISPVFQTNNAAIQQIENMQRIITIFIEENKEILNKSINNIKKEKADEIEKNILKLFEKEITTENEIDVINNLVKKYDIIIKNKTNKSDIELF